MTNYIAPIALVDLDDTLFQTHRRIKPEADFQVATTDIGGNALSYMNPVQQNFSQWLIATTSVIPVTARCAESLSRVKLDFQHGAVCSHGGTVLNPDKTINQEWRKHIQDALSDYHQKFDLLTKELSLISENLGPTRTWVVNEQGVDLYLVVKQNPSDDMPHEHNFLHKFLHKINKELLRGFYCHLNGNNLAIIPNPINKSNAVKFLLSKIDLKNQPTIGYGDSLSDLAFLNNCQWLGVPKNSQINKWIHHQLDESYSKHGFFGEYNHG